MKSPRLRLKEALFEISKNAFETDDVFKEADAEPARYTETRNAFAKGLKLPLDPEQRVDQA